MHFMAEGTGLFGMGTFIFGEIFPWPLMAGEARLFYIARKVQRKRLMRV
jgi:hypothetical protein